VKFSGDNEEVTSPQGGAVSRDNIMICLPIIFACEGVRGAHDEDST
jgi:hypothetical protein